MFDVNSNHLSLKHGGLDMKTQLLLGSLVSGLVCAFQAVAAPVNINTADAAALADALNGVGPVTSREIVSYREENGAFKNPEDLMNVNGIGPSTFEDNKEDILVGE
jgi:competence protein ComEA